VFIHVPNKHNIRIKSSDYIAGSNCHVTGYFSYAILSPNCNKTEKHDWASNAFIDKGAKEKGKLCTYRYGSE
jgi:hypothetical protein